jgi:hypothetical protein
MSLWKQRRLTRPLAAGAETPHLNPVCRRRWTDAGCVSTASSTGRQWHALVRRQWHRAGDLVSVSHEARRASMELAERQDADSVDRAGSQEMRVQCDRRRRSRVRRVRRFSAMPSCTRSWRPGNRSTVPEDCAGCAKLRVWHAPILCGLVSVPSTCALFLLNTLHRWSPWVMLRHVDVIG